MDTRYLETLKVVAERGSLAAAALHQGLTATAIAQRIRSLENELGASLISRAGRKVKPTAAGFAVLARADRFLSELDYLRAAVAGQEIAGTLRIGAISTALMGLLPEVLERMSKLHPELRIYLVPGTSFDLFDRTMNGALDGAILIRPDFEWSKEFDFQTWRREPIQLIAPPDETRDDVFEILRSRPLIMYDRRQWGARQSLSWLEANGILQEPLFELDALEAIGVLVGRGLGVSVVPDWARSAPDAVKLRQIPVPGNPPPREIGLIFPRNGVRTHLLQVLMESAGLVPRARPPERG